MKPIYWLSLGYYASYVLTGLSAKYFVNPQEGYPSLSKTEYSFLCLLGSNFFCIFVIVFARLFQKGSILHRSSDRHRDWLTRRLPFVGLSGICLAVITLTSVILFTLPIPVMETMAIMSSIVIISSKAVDRWFSICGWQSKKTGTTENIALVFAFFAIGSQPLFAANSRNESLLNSHRALILLTFYSVAYVLRLYSINRCKQIDREQKTISSSWTYFSVEQIVNFVALTFVAIFAWIFVDSSHYGKGTAQDSLWNNSIFQFKAIHFLAAGSGIAFGSVGICSRLLLLLTGPTTTYIALVNKTLYTLAGITSSVLAHKFFSESAPTAADYYISIFALISGLVLFGPRLGWTR